MNNSRGISLVEALVMALVTAIVAVGVSGMVVYGSRGASGVAHSLAFDDLVTQMRITIKGSTACNASLDGSPLFALSGTQKFGDPGTGGNVAIFYAVDGLTPLVKTNGTYNNLTKIKLLLYDMGQADTVSPLSSTHIAALYIQAYQAMGTTEGNVFVSSVVYIPVTVSGGNVNACSTYGHPASPIVYSQAATGSNITGNWFIIRSGDTGGPGGANPPRAGTIDYAFGTGVVTGTPPTLNAPTTPYFGGGFVMDTTNSVQSISTSSWTATVFKRW